MKKLVYLSILLVLVLGTVTVGAQAPEKPAPKEISSTGPAPRSQIGSLSGTYVMFDPSAGGDACYIPGGASTLCFKAESFTNDWEYVYNVWEKFPGDWIVNSVYVVGAPTCTGGGYFGDFSWSFQTSPYEVNIYHPRYQAYTDNCVAYYCFDVTAGAGPTDASVSWFWDGDGYNAAPHWPCSNDGYAPPGFTCDEAINPAALVPPCTIDPGIYLSPPAQSGAQQPGTSADYGMTVLNWTGATQTATLGYSASGTGTCSGPTSSDPIPDQGSWPFLVNVVMDPGAQQGDTVTCTVTADAAGYSDSATITVSAAFPVPAYATDVYPGYALVYWPDLTVPGTWVNKGAVPIFHPAGDFLGDNYDYLYTYDYYGNEFATIDTDDGTRTILGTFAPTGNWTGMTSTWDGSVLYASSSVCGTESYLYTVNPANGSATLVGPMRSGSCMIDIAINADGVMYGVDIIDDSLYMINTSTGQATYVGSTGASANYAQGLDFDFETGILYWAAYTSSGELRTINTTTGASTLVGGFPGGAEVDTLAVKTAPAGEEDTLTCGAIIPQPATDPYGNIYVRWKVEAVDQNLVPMPLVTVDANLYYPPLGAMVSRTRLTHPDGFAKFPWGAHVSGQWTIDVTNMTLAGYTFVDGDNCTATGWW